MAAMLAAIILTALWAWSNSDTDNRALARMATEVFSGLHAGAAPDQAQQAGIGLSFFLGDAKARAESDDEEAMDAFTLHKSLVDKIRADLAAAGVNWEDARPLAFGGVRAQVVDPSTPEPVTAVTGNVYFASGDRVFALEVSAERIDDSYVATDIWQCVAVKTTADNLKSLEAHAKAGYAAFLQEEPVDGERPEVAQPEPVFIKL